MFSWKYESKRGRQSKGIRIELFWLSFCFILLDFRQLNVLLSLHFTVKYYVNWHIDVDFSYKLTSKGKYIFMLNDITK